MKNELVVIDTNVLVSALIAQEGYSRRIFDEFILTGKIKICVSAPVFEEYIEVLNREKFSKYAFFQKSAAVLLELLKTNSLWFEPKTPIDILKDKDDNKFIELAVEAKAGSLVTGNSNDFTIGSYRDVIIYSPKEFYDAQVK